MGLWETVAVVVYLSLVGYLGYLGWRRTQTASDYLVAGRKAHPVVMALSYGATFISTSAIVGFGGVAGLFGMSLLWLTFFNIFAGIFIAFVFLGGRTRQMGHRLDAHTFPELLGRRFDSKFVQVFAGLVIFFFMPLYASAVLIGGGEFISAHFHISYNVALLGFAALTAIYVIAGGLKGVMYTDALQGAIMFVGMAALLVFTYMSLGGVTKAHTDLTGMAGDAFAGFKAIGHQGWTAMPPFGWEGKQHELWWVVMTTLVLGVGIGVLAQPQLAARFMTVKSGREINRAVLVGGVFILFMTGVAFTVGSLSNAYFRKHEVVKGTLRSITPSALVVAKQEKSINPKTGGDTVAIPCKLLHIDSTGNGMADTTIVAEGVGPAAAMMPRAQLVTPLTQSVAPSFEELVGKPVEVRPNATSFTRAITRDDRTGQYMFNPDSIIPKFISSALPPWFGVLFLLTLLAAAMSTLSGQFHTLGTGIGRDVYEQLTGSTGKSVNITRIGMILGIVAAVIISYQARGGYIIARSTAIFFGLCASTFLPAFVGGLYWRRATRAGAKASMVAGFLVTALWLLFVKDKEARALGVCKAIFGRHSLFASFADGSAQPTSQWYVMDPLVVALPISFVVMIMVSLLTRQDSPEVLERAYGQQQAESSTLPQPERVAQKAG